jgi:hypothetical protein
MTDSKTKTADIASLYRRAFKDYGSRALWYMRPIGDPTPADALAIAGALRKSGGMEGRCLAERIERLCRAADCDIDIFQDSENRLTVAAEADAKALNEAGLKLSCGKIQSGKREAEVDGLGETMQLEWVADSAFRFFPAQRDDLFGYVLHPVDLATNKASAAADRREPATLSTW